MGKVLFYMYQDMSDFETTLACHLVSFQTGHEIIPIAYEMKQLSNRIGFTLIPKNTVADALEMQDVEGIIIPGGWNDEQRQELTNLIQRIHNKGKLLAGICGGPQYFARAGVLKGKQYTTTLLAEEYQENDIADPFPRDTHVEQQIVRDQNIITAKNTAFVDFAIEICDWFGLFQNAKQKDLAARIYKGENVDISEAESSS